MAIEIVDLPINSMVSFYNYVSLPEGNHASLVIQYNVTPNNQKMISNPIY